MAGMTPPHNTGFSGATIPVTRDRRRLKLWRAGVLVYRRVQADPERKEWQAHAAAVGAVMQLAPKLGWVEASAIVIEAVAAISVRWPGWMWKGEGDGPDWDQS